MTYTPFCLSWKWDGIGLEYFMVIFKAVSPANMTLEQNCVFRLCKLLCFITTVFMSLQHNNG